MSVESKEDEPEPTRASKLALQGVFLFLLALGLRWAHLQAAVETVYPEQLSFLDDARYYVSWSEDIARGQWVGQHSFFMGPLYPYSLAALQNLGIQDMGSVTPQDFSPTFLVQAIFGAFACLLLWGIARRLMGNWQGFVAGLLGATQPVFIYFDGLLMPSSQVLFVLLATLMLMLIALDRRRAILWGACGIAIGVATLAKGPSLLLLPGVLLWLLLGERAVPAKLRLRWAASLLLGCLPVIGLATAHNLAADGDLVLVTSNAGPNLWIGNGPDASGAHAGVSSEFPSAKLDFHRFGAERAQDEPKASEVSRILAARARAHMADHPAAAVALLWKKFRMFWNAVEVGTNDQFEFFKRYSNVLRLPFASVGWVAPLGLVGMLLALGKWRRYWPLHLLVATQAASFSLFFVLGRYRLASVACLIIFAMVFVDWAISAWRARHFKCLGLAGFGLVAATFFVHWPVEGMGTERGFANQHFLLARSAEKRGEDPREHYANALQGQWREGDMSLRQQAVTHLRVGDSQRQAGRFKRAAVQYQQGLEAVKRMSPAFHYRAPLGDELRRRLETLKR